MRPAAFIVVMLACLPVSAGADVVHPRDGEVVHGRIIKIEDAGVTIERATAEGTASGERVFVRWDLVREASMDRPDPMLERYREVADQLWRARTRLERDDTAMAEPLFERLFERYRGQTNETALLVAEGLLRCRLARGANDLAVIPTLETIRMKRALGAAVNPYSSLVPIFDERTGLCVHLPPAWVVSLALPRVERELASYDVGADTVTASLANLYRRAIRQHLKMRDDSAPVEMRVLAADHPGVALLRLVVEAQEGGSGGTDAAPRKAALEALRRDLVNAPAWRQAWGQYAIGIAALDDVEMQREQAMIALSHLPARFAAVQPYLAGLALARLIEACDARGDAAAAASLRDELATRFPQHPVRKVSGVSNQASAKSRTEITDT